MASDLRTLTFPANVTKLGRAWVREGNAMWPAAHGSGASVDAAWIAEVPGHYTESGARVIPA